MTTVVVAGALANKPANGGGAWSRLTLVRGLLELGVDAYLVEELPDANDASIDFFSAAVLELGLEQRATLIVGSGEDSVGLGFGALRELAETADLLVNVSGHLRRSSLRELFRYRAYLDLDPGFTQCWQAAGIAGAGLEGHDIYFTVGANIGQAWCPIPTCGIDWRPMLQPVVLDDWPVVEGSTGGFTTVSSWRGPYGPVELDGRRYGVKAHEFRRFITLPQLTGQRFELALDIDPSESADLSLLDEHDWGVVKAPDVAGTPESYRAYLQASAAEFCVAQGVYVHTSSGWFSDRTVRYLASGKPALVQDTGFGRHVPTGMGLVPFATLEDAVTGAASIAQDYEGHCHAARALAERYFDARLVLARLLDECGVS